MIWSFSCPLKFPQFTLSPAKQVAWTWRRSWDAVQQGLHVTWKER